MTAVVFLEACKYARSVLPKLRTDVPSHDDRDAELLRRIGAAASPDPSQEIRTSFLTLAAISGAAVQSAYDGRWDCVIFAASSYGDVVPKLFSRFWIWPLVGSSFSAICHWARAASTRFSLK